MILSGSYNRNTDFFSPELERRSFCFAIVPYSRPRRTFREVAARWFFSLVVRETRVSGPPWGSVALLPNRSTGSAHVRIGNRPKGRDVIDPARGRRPHLDRMCAK